MPWRLFATEIGQDLPQLFASGNRSMNVTEHNEAGATEEQQLQLVGHMGHEKRTALKHYDKSRHVHMRRSKSVTWVMRDAESRTSQQVIPRERSADRLQWQARVIVIVVSPHHGGPNTPSPPRSITTLVAVLRVVSPSRLNPPRLVPLEEQHLARLLAPQEPYLRARYKTIRKRSLPQQTCPTRLRVKTATSSETWTPKHNLNKLGPPLVVLNKAHQTQMVPHLNQLGPPHVTEHNEVGATEEQQLQLVGHMGHEKRTALKHYDKSGENVWERRIQKDTAFGQEGVTAMANSSPAIGSSFCPTVRTEKWRPQVLFFLRNSVVRFRQCAILT